MKHPGTRNSSKKPPASALVITLVILVLITVIVVGYLSSSMFETKAARSSLGSQKAYSMATIGMNAAVAQLRDGLGPWDNPFGNFTDYSGTAPTFFWSVSPGRLTRWDYTKVAPMQQIALFSGSAIYTGTTNLVNLNRSKSDGTYPIIGSGTALSVQWVNVLQNPAQAASGTNKITGRYAFWVDDENSKININTADGTNKSDPTKSPGAGTPGEVSLQALQQSGSAISVTTASNIVAIARATGFQSPHEILRASTTLPDLFNSNVFNLTSYNRSPEVNIFGDPKIFLIPAFPPGVATTYLPKNGITQQPLTEIYPTPSQLPGFTCQDPVMAAANGTYTNKSPWTTPGGTGPRPWPMVFLQSNPITDFTNDVNFYQWDGEGFNVALIDKYLSGSNGAGNPVVWPVFSGVSGTSGFVGKYSLRQLDSIAMQISDIAGKTISPEVGNPNNTNTFTVPTVTTGYLSGQLVSGIGRFAKVDELLMAVYAYPAQGTLGQPDYAPPFITMTTYLEWYFPAGFSGMDLLNYSPNTNGSPAATGASVVYGDNTRQGYLNLLDMPASLTPPDVTSSTIPPNTFWHDSLLRNDVGIDFLGNPPGTLAAPVADPDQARAKTYHDPFALYTGSNAAYNGIYVGTGKGSTTAYSDLLRMFSINSGYSTSSAYAWFPGMYWCTENQLPSTNFQMKPGTTQISFSGGVNVLNIANSSRGDPDPVPLEAKRGPGGVGSGFTGEAYTGTVLTRGTNSVIPVNFTVKVPNLVGGDWYHAEVADALVNKFPGDWVTSTGASSAIGTIGTLPAIFAAPSKGISRYNNGVNTAALNDPHYDPDSYWLPALTGTAYPRSARMPNTGYLQYVRTGIIPDDETVPYGSQHGTPYRLLSFAPSTEASNQSTSNSSSKTYPDWAILDLFTIPSTIKPQGTYGGATSGRINPNGAVIYTTDVTTPSASLSRDVPLQAILHGLMVNQTLVASGSTTAWSGGASVNETSIASAIENYIRTNGPLRMPGEICNIPAISALRPANNPTRNDLVRQVIGNLTTQSNVFSVWVAGQSVQKRNMNTGYGQFETGDTVLGEVRYHFIVERYLDPGADGIYGNTTNAGNDGIVGTWDDLGDPVNHPFEPRYLYRVVYSEEIR